MSERLVVLAVGDAPVGSSSIDCGLSIARVASLAEIAPARRDGVDADVVVVAAGDLTRGDDGDAIAERIALVVVVADGDLDSDHAMAWLRRGAEDVIGEAEIATSAGLRRLRFAAARHRLRADRNATATAYATDVTTGLPHRHQFVLHASQLLALREREPAPMAIVVLRLEDLSPAGPSTGAAALLRKAAVRLRAGVRSSDVVASIDATMFAVLLGSIVSPADTERVAAKLAGAVARPYRIGGGERSVAVATGSALYPQDGDDAERLLRRAIALASVAPATAAAGAAGGVANDARGRLRAAANDDR